MSHTIIRTDITTAFSAFRKDNSIGEDPGYDDLLGQIVSENPDVQNYLQTILTTFPAAIANENIKRFWNHIFQRLLSNARRHNEVLQDYFNLTDTQNKFSAGERIRDIEIAVKQYFAEMENFNQTFNDIAFAEEVKVDLSPKPFEIGRYIFEILLQITTNTVSLFKNNSPHEQHNTSVKTGLEGSEFHVGLQIAGLILSGINALLIPGYYLYCFLTGRPVPFNLHNNLKWAFSVITLALGLISFFVAGASAITLVVLAAAVNIYSLVCTVKYVCDSLKLKYNVKDNELTIQLLEEQIHYDTIKAEQLQRQYEAETKKDVPDLEVLHTLSTQLDNLKEQNQRRRDKLKDAEERQLYLQVDVLKSKSIARPMINISYALLAIAFVVGVALIFNPVTAPAAGVILLVGSILTLATHIANRIHQAYERPKTNEILINGKKDDIELSQLKISKALKQNRQTHIAELPEQQELPSLSVKFEVPISKLQNPFFARPPLPSRSIPLQDQPLLQQAMRV